MKQFRFVFGGKVIEIEATSSQIATAILESDYPDLSGVYSEEQFDADKKLWIDLDSNEPSKVQETFDVIVSKEYRVSGIIKIAAVNAEAAEAKVNELMVDFANGVLQTNDPCIEWNNEQDYVDDTFMTDGVQ